MLRAQETSVVTSALMEHQLPTRVLEKSGPVAKDRETTRFPPPSASPSGAAVPRAALQEQADFVTSKLPPPVCLAKGTFSEDTPEN